MLFARRKIFLSCYQQRVAKNIEDKVVSGEKSKLSYSLYNVLRVS